MRSHLLSAFVVVATLGLGQAAQAGYTWNVTNPVQGQTYPYTSIPLTVLVTWQAGDTPVYDLDIQVYVGGLKKTYNLQGQGQRMGNSYYFSGSVAALVANPNTPATVVFTAEDIVGTPIPGVTKSVGIQLKP